MSERQHRDMGDIDLVPKHFGMHVQLKKPLQVDWHEHAKHQLMYSEGGVLYYETALETAILPARFGAWIPAGTTHRISSNSVGLFLRVIYFSRFQGEDPGLSQFGVFPISNLAREMIIQTENWKIPEDADALEKSFFETIRLMVLVWLKKSIGLQLPAPVHPVLVRVTEYIRTHLDRRLRLTSLASESGCSPRTLMRLFQSELGMPFSSYLRTARITKAMELMNRPGARVTQTAYDVGYESLGSFSTAFHRLVGKRPAEYLKELKIFDTDSDRVAN